MLKSNVCFVFGAGTPPSVTPQIAPGDFVIAADGGYAYTCSVGITANVVIGDFDSLEDEPEGGEEKPLVVRLPRQKNQTDMLAALQMGLELGFVSFHIFGGTGGRTDHTLANIQCLNYLLGKGARGYLYDDRTVLTAMRGKVWLTAPEQSCISVFALGGPARGVYIRGLRYELDDALLSNDFPLGVSNEFTQNPAYVGVDEGSLLLVYPIETIEHDDSPQQTRLVR